MVAERNVVPFLTDGLKRMEYRGYDSAGVAVHNPELSETFIRRRAQGKITALNAALEKSPIQGNIGIGHIRWATHGEPTVENAHPHHSATVSVVHNGIIENWQEIKQELLESGYVFASQTDTEVVAHLVQYYLDKGLSALEAFRDAVKRLQGAYALAAMIEAEPNSIFVARLGSPLLLGEGDDARYVGSDALALAQSTDKVRYLEEGDYAQVSRDSIVIYDDNDAPVERELVETGLTADAADKSGFPHFMLKEIHEQPQVIADLIEQYVDVETQTVKPLPLTFDPENIDRVAMIACGTAYHASILGKYWIETLARLAVDVDVASEYRYRDLVQPEKGVFIAVSQSGETADTLAALRRAQSENQHAVAVVNVSSSTMARESTDLLLTHAGTEIGVASTKAFIAQSVTVLCLAIWLGRQRGTLTEAEEQLIIGGLLELPQQTQTMLQDVSFIQKVSHNISRASDVLFLGRGHNYPIALEAALKLKELSYIHAEGYASGEMKHGAIALIDENVPVVCLCPSDGVLEKSLSNMQEVAARKARVVLVAEQSVCDTNNAEYTIVMPAVHEMVGPILYTVPMQLLSYYAAVALGKDVDQPRNLAKSVTVE